MRRSGAPSHRGRLIRDPKQNADFAASSLTAPFKRPIDDSASNTPNKKTKQLDYGKKRIVRRAALLPFLSIPQGSKEYTLEVLFKPFKTPCPKGMRTAESEQLFRRKTLGCLPGRRSIGGMDLFKRPAPILDTQGENDEDIESESFPKNNLDHLPPYDPLVLWEDDESGEKVIVPEILGRFLRPHQREGVKFVFDCITGLNREFPGRGCILADDMGLGKTLQSITILYTMTIKVCEKVPWVRRALVVTPTSLVKNWDKEITKWLDGRLETVALAESCKQDVIKGIRRFFGIPNSKPAVLIISYDTFRLHMDRFPRSQDGEHISGCDLLICDEAHRLKNSQTQTNKALAKLECKRRVLLSGTPMQNDLNEFYSMVDFTNPGLLGTPASFRKRYERPIQEGRELYATDKERELGEERSAELSALVNQFILRRTNTLLSKHLPPKLIQVVCCRPTMLQRQIYTHFLRSKEMRYLLDGRHSRVLASITALKKLCNHPQLIRDAIRQSQKQAHTSSRAGQSAEDATAGIFADCHHFFNDELFDGSGGASGHGRGARGKPGSSSNVCKPELSGKMAVLARMLEMLRSSTDDRIVIVSNYTQTLDLLASICRSRKWPCVRLDGSTGASTRIKLVDRFNDPTKDEFVFLLSSKAGGCGLNLIGGNRLVLFDPDWNPATDKQAAARVWRDGQKKKTFVYRFLTTGTIEEKIFQRQVLKEGLQTIIVDEKEEANALSSKDLKDLFKLRAPNEPGCDTYDKLCRPPSRESEEDDLVCSNEDNDDDDIVELLSDNGNGDENLDRTNTAEQSPEFGDVWQILKAQGWKCVPGAGLANYYYLKPELTSKRDGILGYNMFDSTADVMRFWTQLRNEQTIAEHKSPKAEKQENNEEKSGEKAETPSSEVEMENQAIDRPQPLENATEDDLSTWSHHFGCATVNEDPILQSAAGDDVSFVFGLMIS